MYYINQEPLACPECQDFLQPAPLMAGMHPPKLASSLPEQRDSLRSKNAFIHLIVIDLYRLTYLSANRVSDQEVLLVYFFLVL